MYCIKCKEDIEKPLILFTGSIACPKCKCKLINREHQDTYEGKKFYNLGESAFYRGILEASTHTSNRNNKYKEYLEKAHKLFLESAKAKYIYANYYLGYFYDRDYEGLNMSESLRCQIAYRFYTSLLDYKDNAFNPDMAIIDNCAFKLLIMLHNWKEGGKISPNYSFGINYEKYKSLLSDASKNKLNDLSVESFSDDNVSLPIKILNDIKEKRNAPIVSIIKCDKDTVNKALKTQPKNVQLGIVPADDEDSIKSLKQEKIFNNNKISDENFLVIIQTRYFGTNQKKDWPRIDNIIKNRKDDLTNILLFEDDLKYTNRNVAELTEFAYEGDDFIHGTK